MIPVLDVLNGVAVRGVGGRRDEYGPLVTRLCAGSNPLDVAAGYRATLMTRALYLADLDAILHQRPNSALYQSLLDRDTDLWLDAGVRTPADVMPLIEQRVPTVIIGLESWQSPRELLALTASVPVDRLLFSVDLRHGRTCGGPAWNTEPLGIIDEVLAAGITRFLILDLADVGQHTGGSTAELCAALRARCPHAEIITGGGIRSDEDLRTWSARGIDGLLIASAIHDGRVTVENMR
ncbi:MAG TPA: HisA/HisF-related TIM barrel protein [Planctomycetaceae bacterium]|nr:HisA/HisF-related TIM barrel protein [Planctomycetaceae bacterium]